MSEQNNSTSKETRREHYDGELRVKLVIPNKFFKEFNSLCGRVHSKSLLVIKNDHGKPVEDEMGIANSFHQKFVEMKKYILDSQQDILFEAYETTEKSLFFFSIDLNEL